MGTVVFSSNTSWFLYNFRFRVIREVVEDGNRVICLAPEDDFSNRLVSELGVEFFQIPLEGKSVGFIKELKSFLFIYLVIRRLSPEIVFNSTVKMNIYVGLACRILGIPFVNNVSGLGTSFIHRGPLLWCVRWLYGVVNMGAQHLFFENEDDLKIFEERALLGDTLATILPGSGVDLQRFQASPLPTTGPITFIMIARLLGDKGVREYAEACRLLKSSSPNARCLLVGPLGVSNRTSVLKEEVDVWHKQGVLEYMGATDDVRPLIEQAHVLVLPSYREGMPRTVLEAAAMGRPAIVTDVPGCRQSIEPEVTGWLCEVRNPTSLAEQMKRFVAIEPYQKQQAGDEARKRVEERFSEEVVVRSYLGCLSGHLT